MTAKRPTNRRPLHPGTIDFFAVWRAHLLARENLRLDPTADQAFWEGYAPRYDERIAVPGSYAQTLAILTSLIRPEDHVLDVGAGTGRFALPLAPLVRHVTALDHSPAMLAVLRAKAAAAGIANVAIVEAAWEAAAVSAHDIVLAAWSLYRQLELQETLVRLVAATSRILIIAAPDGFDPPHRALAKAIWGGDGEPDVPTYLYILGALRQLGVRADLRMVEETRRVQAGSAIEVARRLAPLGATETALRELTEGLEPHLRQRSDGWEYVYPMPAGIITWQRH